MKVSKKDLGDFLFNFGYRVKWSGSEIAAALSKTMESERYAAYSRLSSPTEESGFLQTKAEADLVASCQGRVLLDVYTALTAAVGRIARPNMRIVDLGCWSGALCAWLAHVFPQCRVVGVDRLEKVISDSCSASCGRYELVVWDYFDDPPEGLGTFDVLCSSLGIYFEESEKLFGIDLRNLPGNHDYVKRRDEAYRYGHAWSMVASPEADLVTVLRIPGIERFLAFCDGMSASGWALCPQESATVTSTNEKFPLLRFRRTDASHVSEWAAPAGWWEAHYPVPPMSDELDGEDAAVRFLGLLSRGEVQAIETLTTPSTPAVRMEHGETPSSEYVLLRSEEGHTAFKEWTYDAEDDEIQGWISEKLGLEQ